MFKYIAVAALLVALSLVPAAAGARVGGNASSAPLVTAFTVNGWVYAVRSDGRTIRLTAGTHAIDPVLSPNRSAIAYFTANRNTTGRYGGAFLGGVWTVDTQANPQHLVATLHGAGAGALAWSPDGHSLAYVHGNQVGIWHGVGGGPLITVYLPHRSFQQTEPTIAWSRDSRSLAIPLPPVSLQYVPRDLKVVIVNVSGGAARMMRVTFPPALMGSATTANGSHPDSSQIAWTANGRGLVVATTVNGEGNSLSGIWTVARSGGTAHLLFGYPGTIDERHSVPALNSTTHFLLSPDWVHLATDPPREFWVGMTSGADGHVISARMGAASCVIAQWTWLVRGQGLVYISLCNLSGTPLRYRSTLYTLSLRDSRIQPITSVVSADMDALSLAPAVRCVACGG